MAKKKGLRVYILDLDLDESEEKDATKILRKITAMIGEKRKMIVMESIKVQKQNQPNPTYDTMDYSQAYFSSGQCCLTGAAMSG